MEEVEVEVEAKEEEEGALDGLGACGCMVALILHVFLSHTASNHLPASTLFKIMSEQY